MPSTALIFAKPTKPNVNVFALTGLPDFPPEFARTIFLVLESFGMLIVYQNQERISSSEIKAWGGQRRVAPCPRALSPAKP
jgi:hypothetical protein